MISCHYSRVVRHRNSKLHMFISVMTLFYQCNNDSVRPVIYRCVCSPILLKPDGTLHNAQGCGNTMPDLSDLVQFHSGQVENFYLLVFGQVQMYKVNTFLYFIF